MLDEITPEDLKREISILCVEDELIIMESLKIVLKRRFKNIYTASNGKIAMEVFRKNDVDIVLTDILMPVMDGIEMAEQIKAISPDTPIIILSALNEEHYIKKAQLLGITRYITKPFNDEEFFRVIIDAAVDVYKSKKMLTRSS